MKYFKILKTENQTTLKRQFSLTGSSIIKNKKVVVTCKPAKKNTGIVFLFNNHLIKATFRNIKKTRLHTTVLGDSTYKIYMVEHLLSVFNGLGVDNVLVEIQGDNQLPFLDGSSYLYAKEVRRVGIQNLRSKRKVLQIVKPLLIKSKSVSSFAFLLPCSLDFIQVMIDFPNLIGYQECIFDLNNFDYLNEISRARTFFIKPFSYTRWSLFKKQMQFLPERPKDSNVLVYDKNKFITGLRYLNEPVRHKALDFLGDIFLLGYRLQGRIIVYKPGHAFTVQIIKKIIKNINQENYETGQKTN